MKMKKDFEIGDIVVVKKPEGNYPYYWNFEMQSFVGKKGTVINITHNLSVRFDDNNTFYYEKNDIRLCPEEEEKPVFEIEECYEEDGEDKGFDSANDKIRALIELRLTEISILEQALKMLEE